MDRYFISCFHLHPFWIRRGSLLDAFHLVEEFSFLFFSFLFYGFRIMIILQPNTLFDFGFKFLSFLH